MPSKTLGLRAYSCLIDTLPPGLLIAGDGSALADQETTMLAITAVIRVRKGCERDMHDQLVAVAENARSNEPGTISYFVSQDLADPAVFTTYERYADQAAMDAHNNSQSVARFFAVAKPMLDGAPVVVSAREVFAK